MQAKKIVNLTIVSSVCALHKHCLQNENKHTFKLLRMWMRRAMSNMLQQLQQQQQNSLQLCNAHILDWTQFNAGN